MGYELTHYEYTKLTETGTTLRGYWSKISSIQTMMRANDTKFRAAWGGGAQVGYDTVKTKLDTGLTEVNTALNTTINNLHTAVLNMQGAEKALTASLVVPG